MPSQTNDKLKINTYQLVYRAGMDNGIRCLIEKCIQYLLHGSASGLDIVLKWVILLSDIHHKRWNESVTPGMMINPLWKVLILEFFVAICHFGFLFNNEFLVEMLVQPFISK